MAPKGGVSCGLSITICEKRSFIYPFKNSLDINSIMDIFQLIAEVGAPIAGALVMGYFIFLILKQMMRSLIDEVKTLTMFCKSLETRVGTMNNDIIKIDLLVSSALELTPPIDRVARAENFVEDGKIDARRD